MCLVVATWKKRQSNVIYMRRGGISQEYTVYKEWSGHALMNDVGVR
jgi:hypothetical protein